VRSSDRARKLVLVVALTCGCGSSLPNGKNATDPISDQGDRVWGSAAAPAAIPSSATAPTTATGQPSAASRSAASRTPAATPVPIPSSVRTTSASNVPLCRRGSRLRCANGEAQARSWWFSDGFLAWREPGPVTYVVFDGRGQHGQAPPDPTAGAFILVVWHAKGGDPHDTPLADLAERGAFWLMGRAVDEPPSSIDGSRPVRVRGHAGFLLDGVREGRSGTPVRHVQWSQSIQAGGFISWEAMVRPDLVGETTMLRALERMAD
jgi:hypothetical protein